tara:strand:+ start:968 stop:1843 length:876 start_codon:yes stop_codon:yes gene_type:complete
MNESGIAVEKLKTNDRGAMRMFLRNKAAVVGLVVFVFILLVTIFGPSLYGTSANKMVSRPFLAPSDDLAPLLGTDYLGRDILAGVVGGGRTTLLVAAVAAAMTMTIGIVIGSLAGYFGGWVDALLMRVTEIFQVMPTLLFSLVVIFLLGPGTRNETLAIGLTLWPLAARLARAEFLRLRELDFVKAARAIGCNDLRIMVRTILPNAMPPLLVSATLTIVIAILFHAGLAFLGMVDVNTVSWGSMLGKNRGYALTAWWTVFFPGLAIVITGLSVSLIGDGLQDAFNPKLRGR